MKKLARHILATAFLFSIALSSQATVIVYDVQNIGGVTNHTWEYIYTVSNDTLASNIELIDVIFPLGQYENLGTTVTPTDWEAFVFQPDPNLPDDGLYDVLALVVPGIAPGDTLGGFGVRFDFLGAGTPSEQWFEIVDPFDFFSPPVDSGTTQLGSSGPTDPPVSVPEPGSLWLAGMGLIALFGVRKTSIKT